MSNQNINKAIQSVIAEQMPDIVSRVNNQLFINEIEADVSEAVKAVHKWKKKTERRISKLESKLDRLTAEKDREVTK